MMRGGAAAARQQCVRNRRSGTSSANIGVRQSPSGHLGIKLSLEAVSFCDGCFKILGLQTEIPATIALDHVVRDEIGEMVVGRSKSIHPVVYVASGRSQTFGD